MVWWTQSFYTRFVQLVPLRHFAEKRLALSAVPYTVRSFLIGLVTEVFDDRFDSCEIDDFVAWRAFAWALVLADAHAELVVKVLYRRLTLTR